MAVIGQIRKHSGLLVVVIGVALAAFVLGDFLQFSPPAVETSVGKIDGTEIHIQQFNDRVIEALQNRRDQLPEGQRLSAQEEFQIRQQIWNDFVEDIIMGNQYEKIGLTVTSEEITEAFVSDQPHRLVQQSFRDPNTGSFDPEVVRNFIRNLSEQTPDTRRRFRTLERMVEEDLLRTKFNNLLTSNYHIPQAFAKLDHQTRNKSADIRLVARRYSDVADTLVNVTDKHLRDYYNEFRHNYKQDELRSIDYVIFEVLPSDEDRAAAKEDTEHNYRLLQQANDPVVFMNSVSDTRIDTTFKKENELPLSIASELFNAEIGTIKSPFVENDVYKVAKLFDRQQRPDSIKMSQILISYETAPAGFGINDRTEEQANALVDSLINVLRRNPGRYDDFAVNFSDYPGAEDDKGEIGWVVDGDQSMANFYNQGFKLNINEPGRMETALGFHILMVKEKTQPIEKVKIGIMTRSIEPSSETYRNVFGQASKFASTSRTISQFNEEVANMGLNKRSADRLAKMTNRIPGIENRARQIVNWAFSESTRPGAVSSIFEDENQFIVAALRATHAEGYQPFDEVKEQIRPLVLNRLKGDFLVNKINELNINDLSTLANHFNTKVDTVANLTFSARNLAGFGREAEVIGRVFTLTPEQLSPPIKGTSAVFVVKVDRFNEPAELTDFTSVKFQLRNAFNSRVNNNAHLRALENNADIVDNRIRFF